MIAAKSLRRTLSSAYNLSLQTATRDSSFLSEVSKQLASSLDFDVVLRVVARAAIPELADWCAVDILTDDGSIERQAVAHVDPVMEEAGNELAFRSAPSLTELEGVPRALRSGQLEMIPDIADAPPST